VPSPAGSGDNTCDVRGNVNCATLPRVVFEVRSVSGLGSEGWHRQEGAGQGCRRAEGVPELATCRTACSGSPLRGRSRSLIHRQVRVSYGWRGQRVSIPQVCGYM
jgi:hypothetical protein